MDSIGYIVRRDTLCYEYAKLLFENVQAIFSEQNVQTSDRSTHVRSCLCDTIARQQMTQHDPNFLQLNEKHKQLVEYIKSMYGAHLSNRHAERISYETLLLEADRFIYVYAELLEPCLAKQSVTQCMQNRLLVIAALADHLKNIYNNVLSDMCIKEKTQQPSQDKASSAAAASSKRSEPRKARRSVHRQLLSDNEDFGNTNASVKEVQQDENNAMDDNALDELLFGL